MPIRLAGDRLCFSNEFYRREIDLSDGPFSCDLFVKPEGERFWKPLHHKSGWGIPFEAAIKLSGRWHGIGVKRQPNPLWRDADNCFEVCDIRLGRDSDGDTAELVCRCEQLGLEARIVYWLADNAPVFRKQLWVKNISDHPIVLENAAPDLIYSTRRNRIMHYWHDYRCEVMQPDRLYPGYTDFQFPESIDRELVPGEELQTFRVFQVVAPEDPVHKKLVLSRVLRLLAPWCAENQYATFQFSGATRREELEAGIEQCRETGMEQVMFFFDQLFTNTGDYIPRPELFPGGWPELVRFFERIHAANMRLGVYVSYVIAFTESRVRTEHPEWECTDADGRTFDPGACGNMCFLSGWGDYIRNVFFKLADAGVDELQIDGPTDIPCCRHGIHRHRSQGEYQYNNWLWEKALFDELHRRGIVFTIPRGPNYLLMGAAAITGGYCEEDFCHSADFELLTNYRGSIYASRAAIPGFCGWGFLSTAKYHGHSIELSEKNSMLYDHGLASLFGYGHGREINGVRLYEGPATRAVLERWLERYRRYRYLYTGDFIGLAAPGSGKIEATMFVNGERREALLMLLNPECFDQSITLLLPLNYAGLGGTVFCNGEPVQMEPDGQLLFRRSLPGMDIQLFHFTEFQG